MRINEEEKQAIRDRLAEIRRWLLENPLLGNPMTEELIRESNILNVRLRFHGAPRTKMNAL